MRFLIPVFLLLMISCSSSGVISNSTNTNADFDVSQPITEQTLAGRWHFRSENIAAAEVERLTKIKGAFSYGGYFKFNADKTYEFEFTVFAQQDEYGSTATGTYRYEDNVLYTTNSKDNKTKKSSLKYEDDSLVVTSLEADSAIPALYLRRFK